MEEEYMFRVVSSGLLMIGGVIIILLGIFSSKNIKENYDDSNLRKKHKAEKLLDLIIGSCFLLLGMLSVVNILTGTQVGLLGGINFIMGKLIENRISKKYKIKA